MSIWAVLDLVRQAKNTRGRFLKQEKENHIRTKADLMKYALENTYKKDSHGGFASFDYDEALKLYEFFLKFVALPDTEPSPTEGLMSQLGVLLKEPTANTVCQ